MNATVTYSLRNLPHPWDDALRKDGGHAWCLVKVTKPEAGAWTEEPVAVFAWGSEAETFQGHIYVSDPGCKLIEIDPDVRNLFKLRERLANERVAKR